MRYIFVMGAMLLVAASAQAGMIGDPVTSILHTAFAGSWSSGGSATVGPGIEFTRSDSSGVGFSALLTLDIAATSFTLTDFNPATSGSFNLGIDGFEFTDLNQTFAGVSLVPGNTFPNGTFTSTSVSPNTIHISMNEPVIPGGQTWSATWNVSFGSTPTPEPSTLGPLGLSLAALALRLRHSRKARPAGH
jgi:hypothetical protein